MNCPECGLGKIEKANYCYGCGIKFTTIHAEPKLQFTADELARIIAEAKAAFVPQNKSKSTIEIESTDYGKVSFFYEGPEYIDFMDYLVIKQLRSETFSPHVIYHGKLIRTGSIQMSDRTPHYLRKHKTIIGIVTNVEKNKIGTSITLLVIHNKDLPAQIRDNTELLERKAIPIVEKNKKILLQRELLDNKIQEINKKVELFFPANEKHSRRVTHCRGCRRNLDSDIHPKCSTCKWITCPYCGSCGCGW